MNQTKTLKSQNLKPLIERYTNNELLRGSRADVQESPCGHFVKCI